MSTLTQANSFRCMLNHKQKDAIFCLVVFLLYFIIYGILSFRFGMVVEEVHEGITLHHELYVANMRWGLALWRAIFGYGALPLVAGIISGAAIALSLLVHVRIFGIESFGKRLAYGVIYLCGIQWLYQLMYSNQSDVVALSFLLASIAVYLITKNKDKKSVLFAVLLVMFSVACYQAILLYIFVLWGSFYIICILNEQSLKTSAIVREAFVFVVGALLSIIVARVLMSTSLVTPSIVETVKNHQGDFIRWTRLEGLSTEMQVRCVVRYMVTVPLTNMAGLTYPGQWVYASALIPLVLIVRFVYKRNTVKHAMFVGAFLLFLLYVPFFMGVVFLHKMPPRVNIAEPLACAGVWAVFISRKSRYSACKINFFVSFLIAAILSSVYTVGAFARTEAYSYNRAVMELISMHSRGMQVASSAELTDFKIIIIGDPKFSRFVADEFYMKPGTLYRESVHPHIFSGNKKWIDFYVDYLRLPYIRCAGPDDLARYASSAKDMPSWPDIGRVQECEGNIIIKVGEVPNIGSL